ncbi:coatomer subunit alpha-2-like [Senna tora]|uniref:Coatomer subunit alpha-2-like n=1 Tax=Senna tora TaxID=362788 RepID=A0A834TSK1_9FABA|nr:coatomer subunit alpha-2-like [Senna tora]
MDRDGKTKAIVIDETEYIFKLSLLKKRYDLVMSVIRNSQLCGQAMITYLQQKGFPEVALHFVKDERIRFNLALESGNIQTAVASATTIDEKDHWYRLGVEALRQGNAGIVEYAYQRTKNFERLSFLYLITDKLPSSWKDFKKNLKHKKEDISLEQLGNHLRLEEEYRKQDAEKETNVQEKVHMVEEGQSNRTSKKRGKDKDKSQAHDGHKNKKMKGNCFFCGKTGHFKKKKDKDNKSFTKEDKFVAVISEIHLVDNDESWWVDSGATRHVCKNMNFFKTLEEEDGDFHNALYLGDVRERVKILESVGHLPLAYVTASVHGLHDVVERLVAELGENAPPLPLGKAPSLLLPPPPVMCGGDWPLLWVMRGIFEGGFDNSSQTTTDEEYEAAEGDWGEDLDMVDVDGLQNGDVTAILEDGEVLEENDEEGGWELEDLELPPESETPKASTSTRSSVFVAPQPGMPISQIWIQRSSLAAVVAWNFDTAMRLLNRQLGMKNFTPLKSMFLDLYTSSHSYLRAFSSAPVITLAIERGWTESSSPNVRGPPALPFKLSQLDEKLKAGYKSTTAGKFTDALRTFINILHTIPLIVVETRREVDDVKELIVIVKEYVLGLQMELKRREMKDDPISQQELAAYFTHCNLQTPHLRLSLLNAMNLCYKEKNLTTVANFARRILETNPTVENQAKTARQVLAAAERNMVDATQLNYDFRNPFVTCGATYVPIYRGQKDVSCPYCMSRFVPSQEGNVCAVCDLAVLGADASGLLCSPAQIRIETADSSHSKTTTESGGVRNNIQDAIREEPAAVQQFEVTDYIPHIKFNRLGDQKCGTSQTFEGDDINEDGLEMAQEMLNMPTAKPNNELLDDEEFDAFIRNDIEDSPNEVKYEDEDFDDNIDGDADGMGHEGRQAIQTIRYFVPTKA